jgi:hypothetical protein
MSRDLAALVLALALFAPARAEDAASPTDMKCFVVMVIGASSSNPSLRDASAVAALYYLGRIDGRTPQLDLRLAVEETMKEIRSNDVRPEALRCSAELKARGQTVREMGARIQADLARVRS